jgi:thiol-activated cytolysin
MKQKFTVTCILLLAVGLFAESQVISLQKLDPKIQQTLLGKKRIVLSKGIVMDTKINKPSNVEMTLRRVSNVGNNNSKKAKSPNNSEDSKWICKEEYVDQTTSGDNVALSPLSGEIFPGLIFSTEAFHSGTYKKISQYARKPIKLTVDGNCYAEKNISNPTESNIASAVNQMRAELKQKSCGVIVQSYYGQEVLSKEDLIMKTAAAGSYMGISAQMNLNFESSSKSYKYIVDYTAPYYSIQTALDLSANNVFKLTTEEGNVPNAISPNTIDPNWVYIKSVTYGKRLLAIVESNEDLEKLGVFAEGKAEYGVFSASASTDFKSASALNQTTVRLFSIGGQQIGSSFSGMDKSKIKNAIGEYLSSTDKNYQPLSFKLKTLDDELVLVQLTSEYKTRKCIPKTNKFKITWTDLRVATADDNYSGESEDVWARVKVRAYDKSGNGLADIDNKVSPNFYIMEKAGLATAATFSLGKEDNPKTIKTSEQKPEIFGSNRPSVTFAFPDFDGKMVIKSYVTEIDGSSANDVFDCGQSLTIKLSDAPQGEYKINCTHEGSKIVLYFTIEPIYQQ